jgi:hypothetical protein
MFNIVKRSSLSLKSVNYTGKSFITFAFGEKKLEICGQRSHKTLQFVCSKNDKL